MVNIAKLREFMPNSLHFLGEMGRTLIFCKRGRTRDLRAVNMYLGFSPLLQGNRKRSSLGMGKGMLSLNEALSQLPFSLLALNVNTPTFSLSLRVLLLNIVAGVFPGNCIRM